MRLLRSRNRLLVGVCLLAGLAGAAVAGAAVVDHVRHVFGRRYCELLVVRRVGPAFAADVYNTYGLNDCPARTWNAIDTAAVAQAQHAVVVVRNGPRYWLMNEIDKRRTGPRVVRDLGGLRMIREATLALPTLSSAPYTVHRVDRGTTWVYAAGQTVFELRATDGSTWVMQSFSRQIDPHLGYRDLARLGGRLTLPAGWSYRVRRLRRPLRIVTTRRAAQVLQDNLDDTYTRV
jgi:hypothetical protein